MKYYLNLRAKNLDHNMIEQTYKRLMNLNKHVENLFKTKLKKFQILKKNFYGCKKIKKKCI